MILSYTAEEAKVAANRIGYPVLVRPSYVLGGQGMHIAFNDDEIVEFIDTINQIAQDHPILIDKYLMGKEIEVDAVCDGDRYPDPGYYGTYRAYRCTFRRQYFCIPGTDDQQTCKRDDCRIYKNVWHRALHVVGLINIQFIVYERGSIRYRSKPAFQPEPYRISAK